MGQLCGREDHFDNLGQGHTLGSASSAAPKASTNANPPPPVASTGYSVASKGKSASTSPPQRLGGAPGSPPTGAGDAERREAMLKAVEAREKSAKTRGTTAGGKIATQLQNQSKDGGRAAEARLEAERRGEQLVWD